MSLSDLGQQIMGCSRVLSLTGSLHKMASWQGSEVTATGISKRDRSGQSKTHGQRASYELRDTD